MLFTTIALAGKSPTRGKLGKQTNAEAGCTGPLAHNCGTTQYRHGWTTLHLHDMVLYLWSPTGQVECRALCLKGAHPMLPVVTPSRCEEPGFGGGGEMLLAEEHQTQETQ